mmetsp:Transcript_13916/g.23069  ORF Transcript_13916/g.23069 Transcript_13916/m.23069 type:complete len:250 (+) Transcript_13916:568-1317(+)
MLHWREERRLDGAVIGPPSSSERSLSHVMIVPCAAFVALPCAAFGAGRLADAIASGDGVVWVDDVASGDSASAGVTGVAGVAGVFGNCLSGALDDLPGCGEDKHSKAAAMLLPLTCLVQMAHWHEKFVHVVVRTAATSLPLRSVACPVAMAHSREKSAHVVAAQMSEDSAPVFRWMRKVYAARPVTITMLTCCCGARTTSSQPTILSPTSKLPALAAEHSGTMPATLLSSMSSPIIPSFSSRCATISSS